MACSVPKPASDCDPPLAVSESYRYCERIARRAASNFCWSFRQLPGEKRRAMYALYAFSRETDDLVDRDVAPDAWPGGRAERLTRWRTDLLAALAGDCRGPLWPSLQDAVQRYQIPPRHLLAIVRGVEMDLTVTRYRTFADLADYCRHVASAVGLACLHVWGVRDEAAFPLGETCGIAFQMTNVLRDLREDFSRGRVYLPLDEFERFGCSPDDLANQRLSPALRRLIDFQIERTAGLFAEVRPLPEFLSHDGRRVFGVMFATYHSLFQQVARRRGLLLSRRLRVPVHARLQLLVRGLV